MRTRFLRLWLLWSGLYMLLVTLGPNGLVPTPVWPDISQHLLQTRAWLGHDIAIAGEEGDEDTIITVAPRLDVTPYFENRVVRDPRERGLVSNLAVVVQRPDGQIVPAQEIWTGSAETLLDQDLVCHVGFPPGPAFLLLPLVGLLRGFVAVQWVGAVLGGLAVAAMDRLLTLWFARVGVGRDVPSADALAVLAGAGTLWLWIVPGSGTFLFAQTVATTALVTALALAASGKRWSAGLCLGLAITSRPSMVGALPLFLALGLLQACDTLGSDEKFARDTLRRRLHGSLALTTGPLVLGSMTLLLNHLRFGTPWQFGYRFMIVPPFLRERVFEHGQLSFSYLGRNFRYVVLELPMVIRDTAGDVVFPWFASNPQGMGVLFVTPAFIALLAALPSRGSGSRFVLLTVAWLALILTCLPGLLYYNTGWVHWGGRFLMDAWPMWLLLTATGLRRLPPRAAIALIMLSVMSCSWAAVLTLARVWPGCCG